MTPRNEVTLVADSVHGEAGWKLPCGCSVFLTDFEDESNVAEITAFCGSHADAYDRAVEVRCGD